MSEAERQQRAILDSPSYVLAEQDTALLARRELRAVRLQLEYFKPELRALRIIPSPSLHLDCCDGSSGHSSLCPCDHSQRS